MHIHENTSSEPKAAIIRPMLSHSWIHSPDEDWRGITDPATRKKLQNKLNQRAQRAKKSLLRDQKKASLQSNRKRKDVLILPRPRQGQIPERFTQPGSLEEAITMMTRFNATAYAAYYTANPCVDQLLTLSKFNVLRAFVDNLNVFGLGMQQVEDDDAVSPFNLSPTRHGDQTLPASLCPTTAQRSVPHHPWLDCFPFPQMRDNLIFVPETFDDCTLCTDIMDPASGDVGMLVWGDPWLPQSWEVSEWFVRKWAWVIRGCPEILHSSNYWRTKRGLTRLDLKGIL
ncbi:unnamed protein product [Penicillium salamii]|uniref:BZIP domain-containing protein n=1 Tax=Penicillium salamii TaxID=1612424 RepID=A0A9W4J0H1_9EURO|nr:unnamed protein product [Penicillium salamii]CAG7967802.1 unnamed protein product [Penicillium salamii]CAG8181934.1 unnamed protein product [Penicillium salamii]CAG8183779.1 unnamed protein product [Penicillium salamii]CAG8238758.1 unnamed protein product [Penicillium salamii]